MTAPKPFDPDDPMEIVGVVLDRPMDDAGVDEMARVFIEEYALMGWPPRRIRELFRRPFFGGAHLAQHRLGEERVDALIAEVFGRAEEGTDG